MQPHLTESKGKIAPDLDGELEHFPEPWFLEEEVTFLLADAIISSFAALLISQYLTSENQ